jgi:hypothetical protein
MECPGRGGRTQAQAASDQAGDRHWHPLRVSLTLRLFEGDSGAGRPVRRTAGPGAQLGPTRRASYGGRSNLIGRLNRPLGGRA